MNYISDALDECRIFDPPIKKTNDDDSFFRGTINERESDINKNVDEKPKNSPDICKEKAKHSIINCILKTLCIKLYSEKITKEDADFNKKCIALSWLQPENLGIPSEVYDETIFEKIAEHIKKMDELRTPEEMLGELGLAVQLINSLYIFMLDKSDSDSDNFAQILIYVIILARPKRLIFNIKFIEFFFNEKYKMGTLDYNLTQAKISIQYIITLKGSTLKLLDEEFEKYCNDALEMEKKNKKPAPIPIN